VFCILMNDGLWLLIRFLLMLFVSSYSRVLAYRLSKSFRLVGRSSEDVASGVRSIVKMGVFGIQLP